MTSEDNNNVVFPGGYVFHKCFVNAYKGMYIVQVRRKLKVYYTKSMQNTIIHYLKDKGLIKM